MSGSIAKLLESGKLSRLRCSFLLLKLLVVLGRRLLSCLPTVETDFRLLFDNVFFLADSLACMTGSSSLIISKAEWRLLTLTSGDTIDLRFGGVLFSLESFVEFMCYLRGCVSILWESDSWLLELLPSFLPCLISLYIASCWDYLNLFVNCFISSVFSGMSFST